MEHQTTIPHTSYCDCNVEISLQIFFFTFLLEISLQMTISKAPNYWNIQLRFFKVLRADFHLRPFELEIQNIMSLTSNSCSLKFQFWLEHPNLKNRHVIINLLPCSMKVRIKPNRDVRKSISFKILIGYRLLK